MTATMARIHEGLEFLSEMDLREGWDNVYDYGKRIAGLATFVCVVASLFPLWLPSQTPSQYEAQYELAAKVRQHDRDLKILETVPVDIAIMRTKMEGMERRQLETQAAIEGLRSTGQMLMLGALAWMAKELFTYLSSKVKESRRSNERSRES